MATVIARTGAAQLLNQSLSRPAAAAPPAPAPQPSAAPRPSAAPQPGIAHGSSAPPPAAPAPQMAPPPLPPPVLAPPPQMAPPPPGPAAAPMQALQAQAAPKTSEGWDSADLLGAGPQLGQRRPPAMDALAMAAGRLY